MFYNHTRYNSVWTADRTVDLWIGGSCGTTRPARVSTRWSRGVGLSDGVPVGPQTYSTGCWLGLQSRVDREILLAAFTQNR